MKKNEIIEEGIINGSIDYISLESIKILLDQMEKCICKVDGIRRGSGFFCKIDEIPVLMTNYHVVNPIYFEKKKVFKYFHQ